MTTETETHLRELLAKATPGKWRMSLPPMDKPWSIQPVSGAAMSDEQKVLDAHLFIAAVNAAPALLDELEALRKANKNLKDGRSALEHDLRAALAGESSLRLANERLREALKRIEEDVYEDFALRVKARAALKDQP